MNGTYNFTSHLLYTCPSAATFLHGLPTQYKANGDGTLTRRVLKIQCAQLDCSREFDRPASLLNHYQSCTCDLLSRMGPMRLGLYSQDQWVCQTVMEQTASPQDLGLSLIEFMKVRDERLVAQMRVNKEEIQATVKAECNELKDLNAQEARHTR